MSYVLGLKMFQSKHPMKLEMSVLTTWGENFSALDDMKHDSIDWMIRFLVSPARRQVSLVNRIK